jgi:hypothetical protein
MSSGGGPPEPDVAGPPEPDDGRGPDPDLAGGDTPEVDGPPTPEQIAERAVRADRATRRVLAAVLCLEAIVVLLVPRALAQTAAGLGSGQTATLISLAVVELAGAVVIRRRWGVAVGSVLQLPFLAAGGWLPLFFVVAAIFIGIWIYVLNVRRELVGTPGGIRMLIS